MANIVLSALNLLPVYVDLSRRRCISDLVSGATTDTFLFTRGDTLKGTLYTVWPTGVASPQWYQFNVSTYELALSDGANTVYCTATGWEALGGTTNPHQVFNLEVQSTVLDNALRAAGNSMSAVLEIHISGVNQIEGGAFPQDYYVAHESVIVTRTALNVLPG